MSSWYDMNNEELVNALFDIINKCPYDAMLSRKYIKCDDPRNEWALWMTLELSDYVSVMGISLDRKGESGRSLKNAIKRKVAKESGRV